MKLLRYITFGMMLLLCLTSTQCEDDDCCGPDPVSCEKQVVIDDEIYGQESPALAVISAATIEGDCLIISFGASGCDGASWVYDVVFSTAVAESLPVQRAARFNLVNEEDCDAFLTQETSFDLSVFQQFNENPILINLEGWDGELLYKF